MENIYPKLGIAPSVDVHTGKTGRTVVGLVANYKGHIAL